MSLATTVTRTRSANWFIVFGRCLVACLLVSSSVGTDSLLAKVPQVDHLYPAGGQRGTDVSVKVHGEFDWPPQVHAPGIRVKTASEPGNLVLSIPADLARDRVWIRLYSQDGAADPVPFLIDSLQETVEQESNDAFDDAQSITPRTIVNGVLDKRGDVDCYSVELKIGQSLVAAIAANTQLGSPMDAILQVLSPDGNVVAENHDDLGLDPRLTYKATQSGPHVVRLFAFPSKPGTQIAFHGGANYIYRLTLTTGPYMTHAIPLCVSEHDPGRVEVRGWNLPERTKLAVRTFGDDQPAGVAEYEPAENLKRVDAARLGFVFAPDIAGSSRVTLLPHATLHRWQNANNTDTTVSLPTSTSGCIDQPGQADHYRLQLDVGQAIVLSVEAQHRGSALIPRLELKDPKGKVVAQVLENGAPKDAVIQHTAKTAGEYQLAVTDRFRQGGDRYFYALTVRDDEPDFAATVETDAIVIQPEQPFELPVKLSRSAVADSKVGEIRVSVVELPDGLTAEPVRSIPDSDTADTVTLRIASDGKAHSGSFRVEAAAESPSLLKRFARTPGVLGRSIDAIWLTAVAKTESSDEQTTQTDDTTDETAKPADEKSPRHSFLGMGKANGAMIFDEDGTVVWKSELPSSDGWVLGNNKVLLAVYPNDEFPKGGVVIVDRKTNELEFTYQGTQKEISTAQQLTDGTVVVTELGDEPRVVLLDASGKELRALPLQCQRENAHMQTRMLRVLPNGNYIAPHLLDFAVKEYDVNSGDVVRVIPTDDRGRDKRDWPFTAIRLDNGNTLISCTNGNRIIEVDKENKIVWSVSNDDLDQPLFSDACGAQRLPNGNTVVSSYYAKADKVKLFEVTRDKQVVWQFSNVPHGFHHFQILTTNGVKIDDFRR